MKKTVLLFIAGIMVFLSSCETTKEISLQKDGSGVLVTTNDMSGLIGLAKMSGQGTDEMNKFGDKAIDTVISLNDILDSVPELSSADKDLIRNGSLGLTMNLKNEKFVTKLNFPFNSPGDIDKLDKLSAKMAGEVLKKQMANTGENLPPELAGAGMPKGSFEDYFITTYSKGLIERKLIAEKYTHVNEDEAMVAMKQMASMGIGNTTLIINLPVPAKKAEGNSLTISDDKKKVTITSNAEDFFSDGKKFEFRVEF
jgi:hypothetical protein